MLDNLNSNPTLLCAPCRDFKDLENGIQYKDAKVGAGTAASEGDRVVFDWEGYTIGENFGFFKRCCRNLHTLL